MSVYQDPKNKRRFTFKAPFIEEGQDVVVVPFPAAAARPVEENVILHDCQTALVEIAPKKEKEVYEIKPFEIQPLSGVVVENKSEVSASVAGCVCSGGSRTILLYDGLLYHKASAVKKS